MTRRLTKLRIDEISLVDRGAGDACYVTLAKRADDAAERSRRIGAIVGKTAAAYAARQRRLFGYDVSKSVPRAVNVDQLLDSITSVGAAKRVLLDHRNPIGRYARVRYPGETIDSLAQHFYEAASAERAKRGGSNKGTNTMRTETLADVAKRDDGLMAIAKAVTDDARSYAISEFEATRWIGDFAKRRHPALSAAAAFSKVFCDDGPEGVLFRRFVATCKGMATFMPTQVGGRDGLDADATAARRQLAEMSEAQRDQSDVSADNDADDDADDDDDDALEKLNAIARKRQDETGESFAQAFAKVFSDPSHRALAVAERKQARARMGIRPAE